MPGKCRLPLLVAWHRFFPYLKRVDDNRPAILMDEGTANWRSTWGYVGSVAEALAWAVENDRAAKPHLQCR